MSKVLVKLLIPFTFKIMMLVLTGLG